MRTGFIHLVWPGAPWTAAHAPLVLLLLLSGRATAQQHPPDPPKELQLAVDQATAAWQASRFEDGLRLMNAALAKSRELKNRDVEALTLAAGAPSHVVSQWAVNDQSTARLMKSFYAHLQKGEPKAAAMREAQMKLLRDPEPAHPFYWAPFILMGDWGGPR